LDGPELPPGPGVPLLLRQLLLLPLLLLLRQRQSEWRCDWRRGGGS